MRSTFAVFAVVGGLTAPFSTAEAANIIGIWTCQSSHVGVLNETRVFTMQVNADGSVFGQGQMTQQGATTWPYEFQGAWQIQGNQFVLLADGVVYDQFQGPVQTQIEFFSDVLNDNRMAYTLRDPTTESRTDTVCDRAG